MNSSNKIKVINTKQKPYTDLNITIHYSTIFGCFELIGTCGTKPYLAIKRGDMIILNYYTKSFNKCKPSSSMYEKNKVVYIKPKESIRIVLVLKEHNIFDAIFVGEDRIIEIKNAFKAVIKSREVQQN